MNRPIAISLSPNTDTEDVSLAIRLLLSSRLRDDTTIFSHIAHRISARFDHRFVVLHSSGRQALYDLLRVYAIGLGDEVIIQAFTCIAVPEPILWTGATPIYADIKKDSYSIDPQDVIKKITSNTKAIIVQHTFGIPGPIEEIITIAEEKNIIVIEDCAHAFGASLSGKPLGTCGDAAIISFGRDKCLSSIYGGATIIESREHMEKLRALHNKRKQPPLSWIIQQLLHPILFSIIIPFYFIAGIGKSLLVVSQKLGLLSKAVEFQERKGRKPTHIEYQYPPALGHLLSLQLQKVDDMNNRRSEIVKRYIHELAGSVASLPSYQEKSNPSWLRFPILVHNQKELLVEAHEKNMLLGDWYDAVLVPASSDTTEFRYKPNSCPVAEKVAHEVINLPTYPSLTDTQVTEIIAFVKTYAM
ncbi:MAG TPA: DegT/DnrJ/EryC1/StrS family aminotransferase [Candidatus Andersenbacteria bacterium]|nr:DegT/DnrJ/EryC1/StrS family aminotransferase [Candidatus Andersenbacteria bacterium]